MRCRHAFFVTLVTASLLGLVGTASAGESTPVFVDLDGVRLAIPREYLPRANEVVEDPRRSTTLYSVLPDFRPASQVKRTTGHTLDSRFVIIGVSESRRADFADYMASELERLKRPEAQMQQIERAADLKELPNFEVYRHVRGSKGRVVFVKNIAGEQVVAHCSETAPNPGCSVSFRWQKNIHVRYSFRRHWLSELDRMHSTLRKLLQSFVVSDQGPVRK